MSLTKTKGRRRNKGELTHGGRKKEVLAEIGKKLS